MTLLILYRAQNVALAVQVGDARLQEENNQRTLEVTSRVLKADELATRTEAFDSQSTSFRQPELIDALGARAAFTGCFGTRESSAGGLGVLLRDDSPGN
jgi:hypothetical protein